MESELKLDPVVVDLELGRVGEHVASKICDLNRKRKKRDDDDEELKLDDDNNEKGEPVANELDLLPSMISGIEDSIDDTEKVVIKEANDDEISSDSESSESDTSENEAN